jgi:hypothetical protein
MIVRGLALAGAVALGVTSQAFAGPLEIASGKAVLPMSGLVIDLPEKAGGFYKVSGSWSVTEAGVFDARDVVDEANANGLTAGNWVLAGYFDAGGCKEVLDATTLDNRWKDTVNLWGHAWDISGGVFTFEGNLGRQPAALLCRTNADGLTFLLYRFLLSQPETIGKDEIINGVRTSSVLERASRAYDAQKLEAVKTTKRPEVTNRGKLPAARTVTLSVSKLKVELPDDGFVWLSRATDSSDSLDRMAPFFPEMTLEVARVEDATCQDVIDAVKASGSLKPGSEARNAPAGWITGPALDLDGTIESMVCHTFGGDALAAGLMSTQGGADMTDFAPLLAALLKAEKID